MDWSLYCLHFLFLFLLFLHADALAFIFFGTSFGLPEFFFFGYYVPSRSFRMSCSPRWSRGSLLLPSWFRGDPGCRQCRTGTGVLAFGRALPCPVQASDGLRPALPCPVTAFGRRTGFQSQCSVALSASWVRIMSLLSLCRHRCLQRSLQSPMSSPP